MVDKPALLFLCHRIPFPPNKGDKIRSYNLLCWLAQRYEISLGAFIDNDADWAHTQRLEAMCAHSCFAPLPSGASKIAKAATALLGGRSISVELYRSAQMSRWVDGILEKQPPDCVLVFSSAMGLYLNAANRDLPPLFVDFVDVDSEKWRQYSVEKSWPLSWLFRRESRLLLNHDAALAHQAVGSFFVSDKEAALFRTLVPAVGDGVFALPNGVDTVFFNPDLDYRSPYPTPGRHVVFTGAMDYWPNVDAVVWFSNEVMPVLHDRGLDVTFYVVGSNPTAAVRRLKSDDVVVTGTVDDIRPYIAASDLVVAPLRVARGIQNKVLEAMAMRKIVVTTPAGAEGIEATSGSHYWVQDDAHSIAATVEAVLREPDAAMEELARQFILDRFGWDNSLSALADHLPRKGTQHVNG